MKLAALRVRRPETGAGISGVARLDRRTKRLVPRLAAGDIAILIILAISAFLALARGFVAEVLSIAGWLGAALVTLWTFNDARPYLRQYIEMQLLADILTGVGIFVVALVIFSTISHLIARVVKGSALSGRSAEAPASV